MQTILPWRFADAVPDFLHFSFDHDQLSFFPQSRSSEKNCKITLSQPWYGQNQARQSEYAAGKTSALELLASASAKTRSHLAS